MVPYGTIPSLALDFHTLPVRFIASGRKAEALLRSQEMFLSAVTIMPFVHDVASSCLRMNRPPSFYTYILQPPEELVYAFPVDPTPNRSDYGDALATFCAILKTHPFVVTPRAPAFLEALENTLNIFAYATQRTDGDPLPIVLLDCIRAAPVLEFPDVDVARSGVAAVAEELRSKNHNPAAQGANPATRIRGEMQLQCTAQVLYYARTFYNSPPNYAHLPRPPFDVKTKSRIARFIALYKFGTRHECERSSVPILPQERLPFPSDVNASTLYSREEQDAARHSLMDENQRFRAQVDSLSVAPSHALSFVPHRYYLFFCVRLIKTPSRVFSR